MQILIGCENNLEVSSKRKFSEHIPSGFSMSIIALFRSIVVYRGKDCIIFFFVFLREHAMKIISFQKKNEVINKRATWIIWKGKIICKEIFENKYLEDKKVSKIEIIVIIQEI